MLKENRILEESGVGKECTIFAVIHELKCGMKKSEGSKRRGERGAER